ncbi:hypothetical protein MIR68_012442 [Amoeboaphelidium protococcarum]|nr:hypothetical protein MIR68_012442 [Amoeboaphelidium protococcarum]
MLGHSDDGNLLSVAVALYDYEATEMDHLSFCMGDRIVVAMKDESGWWSGYKEDDPSCTTGWFPANYVEEVDGSLTRQLSSMNINSQDSQSQNTAGQQQYKHLYQQQQQQTSSTNLPEGTKTAHPDYVQYFAEDGTPFYVNIVTNESVWELPTTPDSPLNNPNNQYKVLSPPSSVIDVPFLSLSDQPPPQYQLPQLSSSNADGQKSSGAAGGGDFVHKIPLSRIAHNKKKRLSNASEFSQFSLSSSSAAVKTSTLDKIPPSPTSSVKNLSFTDPHPVPQLHGGKYGYRNNFTSDNPKNPQQSGFDILVLKHRNGKEVCKDIAAFMAERARIEDEYAKQLMLLAKSQFGSQESGTLKTAWNQLKFDVENQAQSRKVFSEQLTKDVYQEVMKFKDGQKKTRKDYEATMAQDRKSLLEKFRKAQRTREAYLQKCRDAEVADALVSRGQLANMTRKDFQKLEDNARKERKKASIAAFDYRTAVKEFEDMRVQFEEDNNNAAIDFESAEYDRIEFLKVVLQNYLTAQRQVNDKCKDSSEMCSSSIESVSGAVDIELFVKSKFTGCTSVPHLEFEQYKNYF